MKYTTSMDIQEHAIKGNMQSLFQNREFMSCVKVEVVIMGSLSLTVLTVSVDVKQHWSWIQHHMWQECSECALQRSYQQQQQLFCPLPKKLSAERAVIGVKGWE